MCFVSDGYADLYLPRDVKKSRKQHKCGDCHGPILVGSPYHRIEVLFDGEWETFRICPSCLKLRNAISKVEIEHGCDAHESEPLLNDMFCQLHDNAEDYHKDLIRLGFVEEAAWLEKHCNISPGEEEDDDDA